MDGTPAPALVALGAAPRAETVTTPGGWDAFEEVVRRHHAALRGFAGRVVRDPNRTDDVLQEAYLRAFRAFADFEEVAPGAVEAWLYRIVYRCCVDEFRRTRRLARLVGAMRGDAVSPAAEVASLERLSLRHALDGLTREVRAAVILVHWCGLDYAAAGAVLGIPPGTVGSRLTTGRGALRAALDPGGSDAAA